MADKSYHDAFDFFILEIT